MYLQAPTSSPETHQNLEYEDFDSNCSTPYVSAPSSPCRDPPFGGGDGGGGGGGGYYYYYSAPASPMHFALTSGAVQLHSAASSPPHESSNVAMSSTASFEFELAGTPGSGQAGLMSSADELFLNGKIRPMKLSTHLERPQVPVPLPDLDPENEENPNITGYGDRDGGRWRDLRLRDKSQRRRTRSMSPLRSLPFDWNDHEKRNPLQRIDSQQAVSKNEALTSSEASGTHSNGTDSVSASSRSSSAGRSSKRWVFLRDFLRSKSEGRSNNKFWATISFSPAKEKRRTSTSSAASAVPISAPTEKQTASQPPSADSDRPKTTTAGKKPARPMNGASKRRVPLPSAHELHYTANRAQAEELRKRTSLPYRQGLFGCLGVSSKSYGAMNGLARALNPVSSR